MTSGRILLHPGLLLVGDILSIVGLSCVRCLGCSGLGC